LIIPAFETVEGGREVHGMADNAEGGREEGREGGRKGGRKRGREIGNTEAG
jgi:hypothetical protein